ncbi:hypothetical protein CY34DRAFT_813601 [Suillus luteus UH-Slu-Lm8-n1]|uniref:Uncharacterized protein n=1 Tax=Suillus luteus UH-Slu-Lm8-n1 TaxID=930992 RepID=A0A0D0AN30_9AGAM|nr:hypothetical protein CY34DRAFT_813601 [Suillus luteus UH-Slu-Lm8-n1]
MTGVRIDSFAVETGCVELDAITTLFARHVGKYVECVQRVSSCPAVHPRVMLIWGVSLPGCQQGRSTMMGI